MAADRRVVRVAPALFEELDTQPGSDRGGGGEPSATDFLVIDLPEFVERFATGVRGVARDPRRIPCGPCVLVATGRLVRAVAVYGLLAADGAIDLIGVELDL